MTATPTDERPAPQPVVTGFAGEPVIVGRDAFTSPTKRRYRNVRIENFGAVRIQSLTEDECAEYEAGMLNSKGQATPQRLKSARRRLIIRMVVDTDGNRLLRDEDEDAIKGLDGEQMRELQEACQNHAGYKDRDIEELAKN